MSQEDVRKLLLSLDGEASLEELSRLARNRYPNRSLHSYLGDRLKALEKKGLVTKTEDDSQVWKLTKKGMGKKVGDYNITEIDEGVNKSDLRQNKIDVSNIVGSTSLESSLVLEKSAGKLQNTEYNPETSPTLIYRPNGKDVTILAHSTGRLTILGADDKDELMDGFQSFVDSVNDSEMNLTILSQQISINNVVATSDLGRELDLSTVAVSLELESVEYAPEQFPGLIYRTEVNPTVLIFNSGKCVITGAKTYAQVLDAYLEVTDKLSSIGVKL